MRNNANIIRLLAAIVVLWGHGFDLNGAVDPLSAFLKEIITTPYNKNLPGLGVMVFFILSGFLITGSFVRTEDVKNFIKKRCLRIYPALWGNLIFIFVLSAFITELSFDKFLVSSGMHSYFMTNVQLIKGIAFVVPQVFPDNLFKGVNGSLWTLPHEIYCYLFVLVLGVSGLFVDKKIQLTIFLIFLIFVMEITGIKLAYIYTSFISGILIYINLNSFLKYKKCILLLSVLLLFSHFNSTKLLGMAIVTIYISFYSLIKLPNIDRIGDLSYGTYLYAFPIQQFIIKYYANDFSIFTQNIIALIFTLFFAFISYRYIEEKFIYRSK